jgi:DNA-directed RNA polymerase I, II, and III subunit RPABC2
MSNSNNNNNNNSLEENNNTNVEVLETGDKIEDFRATYNNMLGKGKKITIPVLTRFEQARIIGKRAMQISKGSPALVEVGNLENPVDIAKKELKERKIPFIIRRPLPNGTFEDWRLDELRILE